MFKFQVNRIKIEDFRHLADVDLLIYVDIKINRWFNSVTWYVNAFQISSQLDENWEFRKYHLSCWPLAYLDLLVGVDLQNHWLVEFSYLKYKSSSNFKSIGWKLRILKIPPLLLTLGICWPFGRRWPYK